MSDAAAAPPKPREGSVFVSYARADDQKPPNENTTDGWVTFFWNNLRWELTNRGAKSAELWLDRYQIDPAEAFTQVIREAVSAARVIVPVFSENWSRSRWCREEVEVFHQTHDNAGELIIPVFKESIPRDDLPDVLQGAQAKEGYRFFEMDVSGELNEFYWRGLRNREAYNGLIRRMATFIIARLDIAAAAAEVEHVPTASGRTIFVAESANELRDARLRLVNDLTQAGHVVLPRPDALPVDAQGYAKGIEAALGAADLAVFLLGNKHGDSPSGTDEPIIDLQLRLARALGLPAPRVLWTPKWLPGQTEAKRDPFEVAARFGGLGAGEEIFGEEITDLSQWLRDRLARKPAAAPAAGATGMILVTAAAAADDDPVFDLARLLQKLPRRVQPAASDAAIPDQPDAPVQVLLLWASAGIDAVLARLEQMPAGVSPIILILPGGDVTAKRRFFREGVLAETLPGPPDNRATALALLERLELLPTEAD